jgi:hypothetical protein
MSARRSLVVSLVVAPAVTSSLVFSAQQTSTPEPITDPEAYAVYDALKLPRTAILVGMTANHSCVGTGEWPDSEFKSLAERLRIVVSESKPLVPALLPAYRLMTWTDATRCCDMAWSQFQARYPGVSEYYAVSSVVFDDAHMKALLYVERHRNGPHSGSSQELRKIDGRWQVIGGTGGCGSGGGTGQARP